MYEIFEKLLQKHNVTAYKVSKETGVSTATLSDWKLGRSTPKADKIRKIADYFGVTEEYMNTGIEDDRVYYINDDAREMAEFMFKNPEYKVLFDASRKVKKEDIEFVKNMIDRIRNQ